MNEAQYTLVVDVLEGGSLARGKIYDKVVERFGRDAARTLLGGKTSLGELTLLLKTDTRFERVGVRSAAKWKLKLKPNIPITVKMDIAAHRASSLVIMNIASLLEKAGAKVTLIENGKKMRPLYIASPTAEKLVIEITNSGNNNIES